MLDKLKERLVIQPDVSIGAGKKVHSSLSELVLVIPDTHIPFQDNRAICLMAAVADKVNVDRIVQIGDFVDFYSISKFEKEPGRKISFQMEVDDAKIVWKYIRSIFPRVPIHWIQGNHEDRLRRFVKRDAAANALYNFRAFNMANLFSLADLDILFVDKNLILEGMLLFTHGETARQQSAYTARAEFLTHLMSGVSGHTHRLGKHYFTSGSSTSNRFVWTEAGHLFDASLQDYVNNPNWQKGFVLVDYIKGKPLFSVYDVPILDDYCVNVFGEWIFYKDISKKYTTLVDWFESDEVNGA